MDLDAIVRAHLEAAAASQDVAVEEFRTRFTEGMAILREQARQRGAELSTELGTEVRARYDTAARQLRKKP